MTLLLLCIMVVAGCKKEDPITYQITLPEKDIVMVEGTTYQILPEILPAASAVFTFTSKDEDVATVDSKGVVSAIKRGDARIVIVCTIEEQELRANLSITVKEAGLVLNTEHLFMEEKDTATLTAQMNNGQAIADTLVWESSDSLVATVENGKVTALKEGECEIIAKSGKYEARCQVSVAKWWLEMSEKSLNLLMDTTYQLEAKMNDGSTPDNLEWSSSNPSVASVENGLVSGISLGECTITAKSGKYEATCKVTVSTLTLIIAPDSIYMQRNEERRLVAKFNNGDIPANVEWSTSDAVTVSISEDGVAKATAPTGIAIITAKSGKYEASCKVQILPFRIMPDRSAWSIRYREEYQCYVFFDEGTEWTSNNPVVASVDSTGKIVGGAAGKAVIYATRLNKTDSIVITVKPEFSVSATKKVEFSPGNLRRRTTEEKQQGSSSIDLAFHAHQYDVESGSGDAFAWGLKDLSLRSGMRTATSFTDWGSYPILRGNVVDPENTWHTLSADEWDYLINERKGGGNATMLGVFIISDLNRLRGLVVLPDNWAMPQIPNMPQILGANTSVPSATVTLAQWQMLEEAGCVFLPNTNEYYYQTSVGTTRIDKNGKPAIYSSDYWTSTLCSGQWDASCFSAGTSDDRRIWCDDIARQAHPVRLVKTLP